ncbi:hypothetical protein PanWU01x14_143050, partial [Parasponia andersonii]
QPTRITQQKPIYLGFDLFGHVLPQSNLFSGSTVFSLAHLSFSDSHPHPLAQLELASVSLRNGLLAAIGSLSNSRGSEVS